jgi:phenylacetate-coenzyme A ligase PaaK-like adenylate-forming protein
MAVTDDQVKKFCDQPYTMFANGTELQSLPKAQMEELQVEGLRYRFRQHRDAIPMLTKLADGQGLNDIGELNDVVPLLFDHTMYKSYPPSLLHNYRFGELTKWLNKLTRHDLSGFDATGCDSVDSWIDKLNATTPMHIHHTSGSSGTFSFMPKSRYDWERFFTQYPVTLFREFGDTTPPETLPLEMHVIFPSYESGYVSHSVLNDFLKILFCNNRPELFHAAYRSRSSSDVALLMARVRAAAAKGELDRLEIPPALLARRNEFLDEQKDVEAHTRNFLRETCASIEGQRFFMQAPSSMAYTIAADGLKNGEKLTFTPNSYIVSGGGGKGIDLPVDWHETVREYFGVDRVVRVYGMTELISQAPICSAGYFHPMPMCIPYILDPDTSEPLPRTGTVTGRWAHYDLMADGYWGGFISGDEVTMHWDEQCACGRTTPFIETDIQRYSEKRHGDDKITCAASAEVYDEAMDFLLSAKV